MGRKILVEFELNNGMDLSFHKDVSIIENLLMKHQLEFASAKILKPQEHMCRTAYEIQECIERNKKAWEERTNG